MSALTTIRPEARAALIAYLIRLLGLTIIPIAGIMLGLPSEPPSSQLLSP